MNRFRGSAPLPSSVPSSHFTSSIYSSCGPLRTLFKRLSTTFILVGLVSVIFIFFAMLSYLLPSHDSFSHSAAASSSHSHHSAATELMELTAADDAQGSMRRNKLRDQLRQQMVDDTSSIPILRPDTVDSQTQVEGPTTIGENVAAEEDIIDAHPSPLPRRNPNSVIVHYCVVHTLDLSTPHSQCLNRSSAADPNPEFRAWLDRPVNHPYIPGEEDEEDEEEEEENEEGESKDKSKAKQTKQRKTAESPAPLIPPAYESVYPCFPLTLEFDSHVDLLAQTGVSSEEQRRNTIMLVRPTGPVPPNNPLSKGSPIGFNINVKKEKQLLGNFMKQYEKLMRFTPGMNNTEFQRLISKYPYVDKAPTIESSDVLLFHDRLSWTVFVQAIQSPADTITRPEQQCPFDTSKYGGDFTMGRKPNVFPPTDTSDFCLPHHDLVFGKSDAPASPSFTQGESVHFRHSSVCDGHPSSQYMLVPRQLFNTRIRQLACKPSVHSMLDLFLEIQDANEQVFLHHHVLEKANRKRQRKQKWAARQKRRHAEEGGEEEGADEDKSKEEQRSNKEHKYSDNLLSSITSFAASMPSHTSWNKLDPDGQTSYWNSNKDFWIINSQRQVVEPSVYLSEDVRSSHDKHAQYPFAPQQINGAHLDSSKNDVSLSGELIEADIEGDSAFDALPLNGIRVMCTSAGPNLRLPPRPPLTPKSPARRTTHPYFNPPFDLLEAVTPTRFNATNLTTFLQPHRATTIGKWRKDKFEGWVDLQGQGRYICPTCFLRWDYCRYVSGKEVWYNPDKRGFAEWEYFSCAMAGDSDRNELTPRGQYLEEEGYIARVDPTPHTALEVPAAISRRNIRRIVYSSGHVSWYGCTTSTHLCCQVKNPQYPLHCRNLRKDSLWIQVAPCCIKHYTAMYHYLVNLFEQYDVEYALGFGTLLTALRSEGASNPYDYDIDFIVYFKGYTQIKALIPKLEMDGYVVIPNWKESCKVDCELYRILYSSPDHLHQTTIDIFLQNESDRIYHPFNATTNFLYRAARIPHNAETYLNYRYPGWNTDQIFTVENWLKDPATGKSPPWLTSSFLKEKRSFNRSLEQVTLTPWARKLHVYAEWDVAHGGREVSSPRKPHISIVWRPQPPPTASTAGAAGAAAAASAKTP